MVELLKKLENLQSVCINLGKNQSRITEFLGTVNQRVTDNHTQILKMMSELFGNVEKRIMETISSLEEIQSEIKKQS